ncbi:hypothetical protein Tsubulata_009789 [Turnera subulata]|uniref:Longin domain-containing protein n=1 Tax=Turnera subulata TaxID=218843 RepID=A0A9Q0JQY2_9ROSI|nr:hypothetical protein Tsubulata_009789 [Turnera subulata]
MFSNPHLVFYACVAKGPTILTEFKSPEETGIDEVARRCVEIAPAHHSIFSHTIRKKTYTFLIEDPFVYFAIFDENIPKLESLSFLNLVKSAFEEHPGSNTVKDGDELAPLCLQDGFYPMFREILAVDAEVAGPLLEGSSKPGRYPSMDSGRGEKGRRPSMDSSRGGSPGMDFMVGGEKGRRSGFDSNRGGEKGGTPRMDSVGGGEKGGEEDGGEEKESVTVLVNQPQMLVKKKKRSFGEPNGGDYLVKDGATVDEKGHSFGESGNREFSVTMMQKNGGGVGLYSVDGKQKAKQIWRKHVWVVLILDLLVCAVLFGVWLWVCRGFKCIDG